VEEALLVHEAEVARAEPTARQQHRPGVLRVVVVAGHDTRALHPDLALLVRRQRDFGAGVARDDLHRDAGAGLAYREEPAARIESERHRARPDRHGERRLGEAIAGRDDALEAEARLEGADRSEEHTSELQSLAYLVCRLLLEKKKKND